MSTPLNNLIALHDYKKRFHQLHAALKNGLLAGIELGRELNKFIPSGLWKQEADTETEFFQKNFPDWTPRYIRRVREAANYTDALKLIADSTGETVEVPKTVEGAVKAKKKEKSKTASKEEVRPGHDTSVGEHKKDSPTPPKVYDVTGCEVHPTIVELYQRASELKPLLAAISDVRCAIEKGCKESDPIYEAMYPSTLPTLDTVYHYIKSAALIYVCGFCQGKLKVTEQSCSHCHNTGLMTKDQYERGVPVEIRTMREKMGKARK